MNQLQVIEYSGQRVLTTSQLADSFGAEPKTINNNFGRNRDRYTRGKHYFEIRGHELESFKASHQIDDNLKFAPVIYLWTEKGAWMQAKSLNTDRAWEAYELLVDDYYRVKEASIDLTGLSPQLQLLIAMEHRQMQIEQRQQHTEQQITVIKETFLQRDESWRQKINGMINGVVRHTGAKYSDVRNASYAQLEERAHCDLTKRLNNLKGRLFESGATKSKIEETNRMDVIEADPRLKEIYTTIVKELSIGTLA